MSMLRIFLGFALALWMIWATLQLVQIKAIALEACGIAAGGGPNADGGIHIPVTCPALGYDEVH